MTIDAEAGPVVFSPDAQKTYRYTLTRRWNEWLGLVNFIMLNPSTADEHRLDATLRRCRGFADSWSYGGFVITNLFAYRSKNRMVLRAVEDPVGPDNDFHIIEQAQQAEIVVCGWGVDGKVGSRAETVKTMLRANGIKLHYLKLTNDGQPGHPLYLSTELRPTPWD